MALPRGAQAAIPPQYQPGETDFATLGAAVPAAFAPVAAFSPAPDAETPQAPAPVADAAAAAHDDGYDIHGNHAAVGGADAAAAARQDLSDRLHTMARVDGDEPNALASIIKNDPRAGEGGNKGGESREKKERDQAYRTAIQMIQDQIARLDQQIAYYENLIEQNNERIGELNQELNAIDELEALGGNLDPSNPRHAELLRRAGIDPSTVDPDNPQAALERRRREVTDEIGRLERENDRYRQQVDELKTERESLERQAMDSQNLHSQLQATRSDSSPAAAAQRAEAVRSAGWRTQGSVAAHSDRSDRQVIEDAIGFTDSQSERIAAREHAVWGRPESPSPEVSTGPDSETTPLAPLAGMDNPFAGGEPVAVAAAETETPDQPLAALAGMDNPFAAAEPAVATGPEVEESPDQPLASVAEMDNPFAAPEPVAVAAADIADQPPVQETASFSGPPEAHPLARVSALSNPFAQAAAPQTADDGPETEVAQAATADMENRSVAEALPKVVG